MSTDSSDYFTFMFTFVLDSSINYLSWSLTNHTFVNSFFIHYVSVAVSAPAANVGMTPLTTTSGVFNAPE